MCLYVKTPEVFKIAEKNIPVYKSLHGNYSGMYDFFYLIYKRNKKEELNTIPYEYSSYYNKIEKGYHSRRNNNSYSKSHLFIIPKGTKYIEGSENQSSIPTANGMVSETIIYVGKNNWFFRLLGKLFYNADFKSENKLNEERLKASKIIV